jgi:hypothetical protein
MLTEVDIERIMHEKRRFYETIAKAEGYDTSDTELYELLEVECPVTETNGLM